MRDARRWGEPTRARPRAICCSTPARGCGASTEVAWACGSSSPRAARPAARTRSASFSDDFTEGEVAVRRDIFAGRLPLYPLQYPLDELLMVHLLARGRGVAIHGSGVVDADGRGTLFAGQSGAGKTTMARLWLSEPGVKILSDERVVLRQEGDDVWMYGTPWHGDGRIANQGRAPTRSRSASCATRRGTRCVRGGHGVHRAPVRLLISALSPPRRPRLHAPLPRAGGAALRLPRARLSTGSLGRQLRPRQLIRARSDRRGDAPNSWHRLRPGGPRHRN